MACHLIEIMPYFGGYGSFWMLRQKLQAVRYLRPRFPDRGDKKNGVCYGFDARARTPITPNHSHSIVPGGFDVMS